MPLLDLAIEKWRQWRADVVRGEESRKQVFKQIHDEARHKDCEKVAYLLWEADGKPEGNGERYYLEAQRRLKGFRWRLYQLHQPFISLEKKVIEPADRWADRANIFQFFSKISPILEALGVLAIPFVILAFEFRQERRQQQFEERIISAQADVRQQQAVREYLSQVTTIHLETDQGKKLREDEELQKLLEANTLALFNELSVREDTRQDSDDDEKFNLKAWERDRKGQVVEFLFGLSWINNSKDSENKEPLVSLSKADLSGANLSKADLSEANLSEANLSEANLSEAELSEAELSLANLSLANLSEADLSLANLSRAKLSEAKLSEAKLFGADLSGANLSRADLSGANLSRADLSGAKLSEANLQDANLNNVKNLDNFQIKLTCNWEQARYADVKSSSDFQSLLLTRQANTQRIKAIKQDKASDPKEPPKCGRFP